MHYDINVAKDGRHFFATAKRSVTSEDKLKAVVEVFKEKFPESEGYEMSVTRWETVGQGVEV